MTVTAPPRHRFRTRRNRQIRRRRIRLTHMLLETTFIPLRLPTPIERGAIDLKCVIELCVHLEDDANDP